MILVDTSVWVDHLQRGNKDLAGRLVGGLVCSHPFVVGELALGNIKQRATVLEAIRHLPALPTATDPEVLAFFDAHAVVSRVPQGMATASRRPMTWWPTSLGRGKSIN